MCAQALPQGSHHLSEPGAKWLHCWILSVFGALFDGDPPVEQAARMVGKLVAPSASKEPVLTKSRRVTFLARRSAPTLSTPGMSDPGSFFTCIPPIARKSRDL